MLDGLQFCFLFPEVVEWPLQFLPDVGSSQKGAKADQVLWRGAASAADIPEAPGLREVRLRPGGCKNRDVGTALRQRGPTGDAGNSHGSKARFGSLLNLAGFSEKVSLVGSYVGPPCGFSPQSPTLKFCYTDQKTTCWSFARWWSLPKSYRGKRLKKTLSNSKVNIMCNQVENPGRMQDGCSNSLGCCCCHWCRCNRWFSASRHIGGCSHCQ